MKIISINERLSNGLSFHDYEISSVSIYAVFEGATVNEKEYIVEEFRKNMQYDLFIDSYHIMLNKCLLYLVLSFGFLAVSVAAFILIANFF
ncbi:hypothetical protein [Hymenobacter sp. APR13]|uniref:hypothetical protein n=1 Tax=Hymenobacter sp. APR13 TaxID=1356852 RepID=UPI0004E0489D|nr:hypothetical protein [Hymenobacter sp. APR13]AII52060.1 hypothetical protein N008_08720 [Hymenobacter sp. APR13]